MESLWGPESHWQQQIPCQALHLGKVGNAGGFLGNLFGKSWLKSRGKGWITSGSQWEPEQATVIPGREERFWFLLTVVCEDTSPENPPALEALGTSVRSAALALPIRTRFILKAVTGSQQSTGRGKCHCTGDGSESSMGFGSSHSDFETMEGKRREKKRRGNVNVV